MKKPARTALVRRGATKTAVANQEKIEKSQKTVALMSMLMGRSNFMSRMAGVQYNGLRDIYATAGYVQQGKVVFDQYWGLYKRGDIAGRIVDMPPKTTWRTPPQIMEKDQTTDGTAFTKAFEEMADRLRLWQYFKRADVLACVGRYAVLFIGVKGADEAALKTPLLSVPNGDSIIYLSAYHEGSAQIEAWETDPSNPRYGQPKLYKLNTSSDEIGSRGNSSLIVHATRVIHVAQDILENEVYGRPRLERVLNRLFDLDKVSASTGEAYWQQVSRILQAKVDPNVEISDDQLKQIDEKLGDMVHDLRRQFSGQGVELGWLDSKTPDVSQVGDFYFSLIAGAAEIPKRILFGSEVGQLASTTDQATYYGMINERQEQYAEPKILRAFIDHMIGIKALPTPAKKKYLVQWPTLFETSDKEQAETSRIVSETARALTPVGGNPLELVEIDEDSVVSLIPRAKGDALPDSHSTDGGTGGAGGDVPPATGDGSAPPAGDGGVGGGDGQGGAQQ